MRGATISHFVCIQTVKLNDKRIYSNDTGMPFGVEKCSWVEANGGRIIGTEGVELSKGHIIDWRQDSCRNQERKKHPRYISNTSIHTVRPTVGRHSAGVHAKKGN